VGEKGPVIEADTIKMKGKGTRMNRHWKRNEGLKETENETVAFENGVRGPGKGEKEKPRWRKGGTKTNPRGNCHQKSLNVYSDLRTRKGARKLGRRYIEYQKGKRGEIQKFER